MRLGARWPLSLCLAACSAAPAAFVAPAPSAPSVVPSAAPTETTSVPAAVSAAPVREPDPALLALALGIVDAFQNESPRPVVRGYGQIPNVLYRSDRRTPRQFSWFEAPEVNLHGPVSPASSVDRCARELAPPEAAPGHSPASGPPDSLRLVRFPEGDSILGGSLGKRAKLGLGAVHGACVVVGRGEIWLGWSTPSSPSELVALKVSDGSVRPLRKDARPGLSQLGAINVERAGEDLLVLTPKDPRGAVVAVRSAPLARWDGWLRLLPEVGLIVVKTTSHPAQAKELARARGGQEAEEVGEPLVEGESREQLARAWALHAERLATGSRLRESRGK